METESKGINSQIQAYIQERPLKQHERELLDIILNDYPRFAGRMLDVGCATGSFLAAMRLNYPEAHYTGIDISSELIAIARSKYVDQAAFTFQISDAVDFSPSETFDIIVASGILSVFDNFESVLDRWFSWLRPNGSHLYIFGRFNSRNVDTIVRFRNHYTNSEWEGGLTSYSLSTVSRYINERQLKHRFQRFHLSHEIAEDANPIRTWTVSCKDGQRLVVNGANIIAEHYFLIIET